MVLAALCGFLAVVSQAILLQELGDFFLRNEVTVGIMLFSWLAGTGLGSHMNGMIPRELGGRRSPAYWALVAQAVALVAAVFLSRWLFGMLRFQSRPDFFAILLASAALSMPAGFLSGFAFAGAAQARNGAGGAGAYVAESVGALAGGLAFTFLILGTGWGSVRVSFGLLALAILFMAGRPGRRRRRRVVMGTIAAGLVAWLAVSDWPTDSSRAVQFRNAKLVSSSDSVYGNLSVVRSGKLETAYYNGAVLYSVDGSLYEEEALLPALVSGRAQSVLVLGFPPPSLLSKIMEYVPRRMDAVYPDPTLTRQIRANFRKKLPRIGEMEFRPRYADPFRWRDVFRGRYDIVMVRSESPMSIPASRMRSGQFFVRLKRALTPGGLVSVALDYQEGRNDPYTMREISLVRDALEASFRNVLAIPAERYNFIASDWSLSSKVQVLEKRLAVMQARTVVVTPGYISHYFDEKRLKRFAAQLDAIPLAPPAGFLSLEHYRLALRRWMKEDLSTMRHAIMLFFGALLVAGLRWRRNVARFLGVGPYTTLVGAGGFAGMAGEILLLNYYQCASGQVFWLFGALAGVFMFGTALGAVGAGKEGRVGGAFGRASVPVLAAWLAVIGALYLYEPSNAIEPDRALALVAGLNLLGGLGVGALFGFVARRPRQSVARTYSADLYGSALAGLAVPLVLIPFGGNLATAAAALAILVIAGVRAR